jgi:hypothetical protein
MAAESLAGDDAHGPRACGIVVIGRNEGERLQRCLASVAGAAVLVYVDSGSTDGSIEVATSHGADVVRLELSTPFTAARARNSGFRRLRELAPAATRVQFVDGDCEVVAGWLDAATAFLDRHPEVAVVCGRRRERFPERSIYNRLCDAEWDTPIGESRMCGGDALMRIDAFEQVGGFLAELIAGEEPELCVRLRTVGWHVWRLDVEMTLHDAAMTSFAQWWRRCTRTGFAFAQGASLHGAPPERHWVREARSAWIWAAVIPALVLFGIIAFGAGFAAGLLVYPLQVLRLAIRGSGPASWRARRAMFLVLGKFPEALGQLRFFASRATGRRERLIEYK